jgi:hypothetical protein
MRKRRTEVSTGRVRKPLGKQEHPDMIFSCEHTKYAVMDSHEGVPLQLMNWTRANNSL